MAERDPVLPQPLHTGQMLPPELGELIGLVRRRVVLLIGQDEQDVRAAGHAATLRSRSVSASSGSDEALRAARAEPTVCASVSAPLERHGPAVCVEATGVAFSAPAGRSRSARIG